MSKTATPSTKLVVMTGTTKSAYHRTEDCQVVPDGKAKPKSERYIEWHDLEACPHCH